MTTPITLKVDYFPQVGGFWFASLQVGQSMHNAPSDTRANAVLQAWSGYTDQQANLAGIAATLREQAGDKFTWTWPSRLA